MKQDWFQIIFSLICGGLALRAVARTHTMLKPENSTNRPLLLHRRSVPTLVMVGFWITFASAAVLGWRYSGWSGVLLRPVEITFASLLLDFTIERVFPLRMRYSLLLNPFAHFFVVPYIFAVGTVLISIF